MFIRVALALCLLYTLSWGQTNMTVIHPTVGTVYPVLNNDSLLNITFLYPMNYQFDKLAITFIIYDFLGNDTLNPQPYQFGWSYFTNSNFSLPWVVPPIILQSGDYIIACFEWVQRSYADELIDDRNQCVLTRAAVNSTILPIASPMTSAVILTDTTINITAWYPAALPYDQINITSTLNGTMLPSMSNSMSNNMYSKINTFYYMNLTSSTHYNLCINYDYANSKINASETMNSQCQMIMTLGSGSFSNLTTNSPIIATTNSPIIATTNSSNNSSNKIISKLFIIILLVIYSLI